MEYWERLEKLAKELENNKIALFERKCGFGNGYINKKPKKPRKSSIINILRAYPIINKEWLEFEKGEMYTNENLLNESQAIYSSKNNNIIEKLIKEQDDRILEQKERIRELKKYNEHLERENERLNSLITTDIKQTNIS
ncbi:MAG: hypothetical protein PHW73_01125 [Atribacterota bacterium]|nr:hypothetical protein [Atribacterota bacterium]